MCWVIPVFGIGTSNIPTRQLFTIYLTHDGIVAFANTSFFRCYTLKNIAIGIRRFKRLSLYAIAIVIEVIFNVKACPDAGNVIETHPVTVRISVRLVRHYVVQAADFPQTNTFAIAIDVRDFPGVLKFPGVIFVDCHLYTVQDVLDPQIASALVCADDAAHTGCGSVGNGS